MTQPIFLFILAFAALTDLDLVSGAHCDSPKYSSNGYSTQDGFFHYTTTYIVEFALQCSNQYNDAPFYAVIGSAESPKAYQMAVSEETSKYQVSWQLDHVASGAQTFDVRIYDEDKFAEYRKAEQNGADATSVQPLFTVQHYHAGVGKKSWVASESVFLLLVAGALYYAFNFRQQLAKRD